MRPMTKTTNTRRPRRRRLGFTLTEMMVALVMFGVVSAAIFRIIRSQQRFYRGANEIIDIRSQLRQAAAVLPLELRSVSTVSTVKPAGSPYTASMLGSDIKTMTANQIAFRATIGSGVVCAKSVAAGAAVLTFIPSGMLAKGNVLTSWYMPPEVNDTIFVFDQGPDPGAADDQWQPYRITAVVSPQLANVCPTSPFLLAGASPAGDADKKNLQLAVVDAVTGAAAVTSTIGHGSVVRFTRSVAYGLYKSPIDNRHYLGYKTMTGTPKTMQTDWDPVSGPYGTSAATNGLVFTYFDSSGVATTAVDKVARVDVMLRGIGNEIRNEASFTSMKNKTTFRDSLLLRVAVRNRS